MNDAHSAAAATDAAPRAPGDLVTWREEGQPGVIGAYLGEHRIGFAWGDASRSVWETDLNSGRGDEGLDGEAPTLASAKSALEAAVRDWVRRAGLALQEAEPTEWAELEADIRWLVVKLAEGQDGWWMHDLDGIVARLPGPRMPLRSPVGARGAASQPDNPKARQP